MLGDQIEENNEFNLRKGGTEGTTKKKIKIIHTIDNGYLTIVKRVYYHISSLYINHINHRFYNKDQRTNYCVLLTISNL